MRFPIQTEELRGNRLQYVGTLMVQAATPTPAATGMGWYDTTADVFKVYDGAAWKIVGSRSETHISLFASVSDIAFDSTGLT